MIVVIEAKDETHSVDAGLEQAKEYVRMLDVPFAYSSNGHGFVEFDFFLNRSRELAAFPKPDNLWNRWQQMRMTSREIYETELAAETIREDSATLGRPADPLLYAYCPASVCGKEPRYFQEAAIRCVIERIMRQQKRIPLTMATGTGKTLVVSLDSVDEHEQTISEDARCTLLIHDTRSASGGHHGVHHLLLSARAMHT